jgi:hypothetical protein
MVSMAARRASGLVKLKTSFGARAFSEQVSFAMKQDEAKEARTSSMLSSPSACANQLAILSCNSKICPTSMCQGRVIGPHCRVNHTIDDHPSDPTRRQDLDDILPNDRTVTESPDCKARVN